jgi:hypothetical protein
MIPVQLILLIAASAIGAFVAAIVWQIRRRNMHRWLGSYLWQSVRRGLLGRRRDAARSGGGGKGKPIHLLLCIADHFEPEAGGVSGEVADARVAAWVREYPRVFGGFRDSDDRPPRHTFFYPIDQYEPRHVDALAELCRAGFGEVEIHLHHDNDTAENLENTLRRFTETFASRHGLLGRWPDGRVAYGFVHGNWALNNSRPDGRCCGVNNEIDVLRRTGCYADFTYPSAPSATQPRKVNSIYYAVGDEFRPKSHERGIDVGVGSVPPNGLMLIQGPLRIGWPRGSRMPRIENACIQEGQPPTAERLDQWLQAHVHIRSHPEWVFVKLHTHGAVERNQSLLLGDEMVRFHRNLAERAARDQQFQFHYVSVREMYNLVKAAESGWTGSIASARNRGVEWPYPHNTPPLVFGMSQSSLSALSARSNR